VAVEDTVVVEDTAAATEGVMVEVMEAAITEVAITEVTTRTGEDGPIWEVGGVGG
jgi:hypothetical protein